MTMKILCVSHDHRYIDTQMRVLWNDLQTLEPTKAGSFERNKHIRVNERD